MESLGYRGCVLNKKAHFLSFVSIYHSRNTVSALLLKTKLMQKCKFCYLLTLVSFHDRRSETTIKVTFVHKSTVVMCYEI